jgi:chromodomain-helicase-DNA-binding protein 1
LPYSEASWEDGPLVSKIGYQDKIDSYLKRERCEKVPGKNERFPKQKPKFIPLKKQPAFLSKGTGMELRDYQLGGLNFLTHSWSRVVYLIFMYNKVCYCPDIKPPAWDLSNFIQS